MHRSQEFIELCAVVPKEKTITIPLKELHVDLEFRTLAKIVMLDINN
jgi:hypothetical protein